MNEHLLGRINKCKDKLLSMGYELTPGLGGEDVESIESALNCYLPAECKGVIRCFEVDISKPAPRYGSVVGSDDRLGEYIVLDICPANRWGGLLKEALDEYDAYRKLIPDDDQVEVYGPAKPYLFGEDRIIFSSAHGLYWAIDMSPGKDGNVGQILLIYPMYQENTIVVVAPDYLTFFEMYVNGMTG